MAAYGAPALPLAALVLPVHIYLPTFYASDLGLGLTLVGTLLVIARLWDGITDPLIGWISDQLPARWGRRRSVVLAGTPLVLIASWMLLVPPVEVSGAYLLGWSLALYAGWTAVILPLSAWGAELSEDYHERSRIAAWREGFVLAGTLAALVLPVLFGVDARSDAAAALKVLAIFIIVLLPGAVALMAWQVPDRSPPASRAVGKLSGFKAILANEPFRKLIGAYLINSVANGLPATLFLLFVGNVLQSPEAAGLLLVAYFLAGVAAVPLWTWTSRRYGKHRVWCVAMVWACGWFALVPFLGPGDVWLFLAISIATGLALGADLVLPSSMQADVVDVDTQTTGRRRAGIYFALWGMATKGALALAVGIAFPILDLMGFQDGGENDATALLTLTALYAALPVILKAISIVLIWRFPITEADQAARREKIAENEGRSVPA